MNFLYLVYASMIGFAIYRYTREYFLSSRVMVFLSGMKMYHFLQRCAFARRQYRPTPWLNSLFLQTLFIAILRKCPSLVNYLFPVTFTREYIRTYDGGSISLDWCRSHQPPSSTPTFEPPLASNTQNSPHNAPNNLKDMLNPVFPASWKAILQQPYFLPPPPKNTPQRLSEVHLSTVPVLEKRPRLSEEDGGMRLRGLATLRSFQSTRKKNRSGHDRSDKGERGEEKKEGKRLGLKAIFRKLLRRLPFRGKSKREAGEGEKPREEKKRKSKKIKTILPEKNVIVIFPGDLTGSDDPVVRSLCYQLAKWGFQACVANGRGGAESLLTTRLFTTCISPADVGRVAYYVNGVLNQDESRRLYARTAIGLGRGGTSLLRYLADEGERSLFSAAVTVSSPFELGQFGLGRGEKAKGEEEDGEWFVRNSDRLDQVLEKVESVRKWGENWMREKVLSPLASFFFDAGNRKNLMVFETMSRFVGRVLAVKWIFDENKTVERQNLTETVIMQTRVHILNFLSYIKIAFLMTLQLLSIVKQVPAAIAKWPGEYWRSHLTRTAKNVFENQYAIFSSQSVVINNPLEITKEREFDLVPLNLPAAVEMESRVFNQSMKDFQRGDLSCDGDNVSSLSSSSPLLGPSVSGHKGSRTQGATGSTANASVYASSQGEVRIVGSGSAQGSMILGKKMTGDANLLSAGMSGVNSSDGATVSGENKEDKLMRHNNTIQWSDIASASSLTEMDSIIASKLFNYQTVKDYYADRSCAIPRRERIKKICQGSIAEYIDVRNINTPVLVLQSLDDPLFDVLQNDITLIHKNRYIAFAMTRYGGHQAFFTGWKPTSWFANAAAEFLYISSGAVPYCLPFDYKLHFKT